VPYLEIIELRGELGTCEVEVVRDATGLRGFVVPPAGLNFGRLPMQTAFGAPRPWVQVIHPGHGRNHTGIWFEKGCWCAVHSGTTNPTQVEGESIAYQRPLADGEVIENPALLVRFWLTRPAF